MENTSGFVSKELCNTSPPISCDVEDWPLLRTEMHVCTLFSVLWACIYFRHHFLLTWLWVLFPFPTCPGVNERLLHGILAKVLLRGALTVEEWRIHRATWKHKNKGNGVWLSSYASDTQVPQLLNVVAFQWGRWLSFVLAAYSSSGCLYFMVAFSFCTRWSV